MSIFLLASVFSILATFGLTITGFETAFVGNEKKYVWNAIPSGGQSFACAQIPISPCPISPKLEFGICGIKIGGSPIELPGSIADGTRYIHALYLFVVAPLESNDISGMSLASHISQCGSGTAFQSFGRTTTIWASWAKAGEEIPNRNMTLVCFNSIGVARQPQIS